MARPSRLGAKNWTDSERDLLFDAHPPVGPHPTHAQITAAASQTGRPADAAVEGRPSTASLAPLADLRARGWSL